MNLQQIMTMQNYSIYPSYFYLRFCLFIPVTPPFYILQFSSMSYSPTNQSSPTLSFFIVDDDLFQ